MEHRLATSASPMEVCSVSIDFHRRFYLTSCGLFQSGTIPEAGIGTGTWQWNIQHFSNSGGSSADFRDTFPTASLCFFPKMGSGGGPKTLPIKLGSNPWFRPHMTPWKYGSQPHLRGGERWIKATAGMGQIGGYLGIHFGVLIRLTQTCVTVGLPGASISIPCPFFLVKPPLCCW
jgi:hypothetical protein